MEVMEFRLSYFKSLKMMLLKCCTQYVSKLGKLVVATGLEMVSFSSSLKERNGKECSDDCATAIISHAIKIMLKTLQARVRQFVNRELPDVQATFRKG